MLIVICHVSPYPIFMKRKIGTTFFTVSYNGIERIKFSNRKVVLLVEKSIHFLLYLEYKM